VKTQYLERQQRRFGKLQTAKCSKFGCPCQDLSVGTFDHAKKSRAKLLSRCLVYPQTATRREVTANKLHYLFPFHTRRTLLLQWLLHMKVSPYDSYPSKGKQGADSYQVQSERRLRRQRPRNLRRHALIRQFKMGPQNRNLYVMMSIPHASLGWRGTYTRLRRRGSRKPLLLAFLT